MVSHSSVLALILSVALTATASVRAAEVTPESVGSAPVSTVTISGHSDTAACVALSQDEARRFAEDAQRAGAHRKAAECFRIAGDLARADRAQLRASAEKGTASAERIKAGAETTKAHVKRLREQVRQLNANRG